MNNFTLENGALNALSLFTGYGGLEIALEKWCRPVLYCEADTYAQSILFSRMSEGKLAYAPICPDIREIKAKHIDVPIDIIVGGFPCQDISCAGNGKGLEGERSGLFFEVCRLVKEIKPSFVFLENVPAIRTRGLREVVRTFTDMGYDCRWACVSAAEVGAPHIRKRWFLLAYSGSESAKLEKHKSSRQEGKPASAPKPTVLRSENRQVSAKRFRTGSIKVPNTDGPNVGGQREKPLKAYETVSEHSGWAIEPNVGRVVNGVTFRVDRIKALGNGVVPKQAETAFKRLLGIE